ncbi:MAG TPA: hypothetical protein VF548_11940 [Allosphingosinicella sp.]
MVAGQHKLSRRALLVGACALPLARHSGLDPESMNAAGTSAPTTVSMDPGFRRDDGKGRDDAKWQDALARFEHADREVEALVHCRNERVYDRALGRHSTALRRLMRAPAPDLASAGLKLELIVRHHVFEANFAEAALASLRRDIGRFAALSSS